MHRFIDHCAPYKTASPTYITNFTPNKKIWHIRKRIPFSMNDQSRSVTFLANCGIHHTPLPSPQPIAMPYVAASIRSSALFGS